nr:intracellular protein transport protein uso1 [Quercus suber]
MRRDDYDVLKACKTGTSLAIEQESFDKLLIEELTLIERCPQTLRGANNIRETAANNIMLKTPPLQTATATIDTLCGRLQSATLLEDRRGAILGLRSFAKQYPASVASGSLRELINILRRDGLGGAGSNKDVEARRSEEGGDVDTTRLVLETLLSLFNPDSSSPEASEEIELFMADEFSMVCSASFSYPFGFRKSVQLLSAVCAARPEKLQDCILNSPLGVSRLVGVLDDARDQVRNAGLLLLVDLTSGANDELKKIIAFEDVFAKIFGLIRVEGGLAEAGITAQDCLSLLANLISSSASNQTMFRESGCVQQISQLLEQAFPPSTSEALFLAQNREKAAWGLLQLVDLFLARGEASTTQNQIAFFRAGIAQTLIEIGFSDSLPLPVVVSALNCAAGLIACNAPLQEAFANLTILLPSAAQPESQPMKQTNGNLSVASSKRGSARTSLEGRRVHIIEALLDRTLAQAQAELSLRAASCGLIQAYLASHGRITVHFMTRAVAGHDNHEKAPNVLLTLLDSATDTAAIVFASWIVSDLVAHELETRVAFAALTEGNESEGEDVLTSIQALGAQLQQTLKQDPDARRVGAYASVLIILLWENATSVSNLLSEGSGLLQALVLAITSGNSDPIVAGLAAVLLGTIYEFSTKDSPIPRRTLAPLLTQKVGRSRYMDALLQLRKQPAIRDCDFEDLNQSEKIFSAVLVELFTTEYSRLRKAIDKDPGVEVLPLSTMKAGVDRDVLDELRQEAQASKDALSQAQQETILTGQRHDTERMTAAKELQTATAEVGRLRKINQAMQQSHESELQKLATKQEKEKGDIHNSHQRSLTQTRLDADRQTQSALRERDVTFAQKTQEYERKLAEMGNMHRSEQSGHTQARQQLESLTAKHADISARERSSSQQLEALKQQHNKMQREMDVLQIRASRLDQDLEIAKAEVESRGEEISRLTANVSELKDELDGKDAELATERSGFGDLEKELDATKKELKTAHNDLAAAKKQLEVSNKQLDAVKKLAASSVAEVKKNTSNSLPAQNAEKANLEKEKHEAELTKLREEIMRLGEAGSNAAKLEKKVEEATEAEKTAKEELENMLLVMGDIETKRDEYRAKIKSLGGEVSEDDAEDDDDGSAEENDDLD